VTRDDFLALVQTVNAETTAEHVGVGIRETPLDSLDLLTLRSTLETKLGASISDETWLSARSLDELYEVLTRR